MGSDDFKDDLNLRDQMEIELAHLIHNNPLLEDFSFAGDDDDINYFTRICKDCSIETVQQDNDYASCWHMGICDVCKEEKMVTDPTF